MKMRLLLPAVAMAVSPAAPGLAAPRSPNIVLILADDLGYECIGANGCTSYKTPVLDRLAATGVRFEHCYAQPLCTPSRVQIMTGIYNVRNYVRFGLLDPKQTTFAHLLKKAGYATCIVGKWQLEGGFEGPGRFGFDDYCLWQLTRRPGRYANPGLEIGGREVDYDQGEYGPDLVSDHACAFMERNKDKPFLVYYPMMLTHAPYDPTPDSAGWDPGRKGVKDEKGQTKHFADMVAYMDKLVGKLAAKLEALGLREDTLILFTGDNGTGKGIVTRMGDRDVAGGKGETTDAGTRVPLICTWPAGIPGGRVCTDLVDFTDFLPTLCEAAGVAVPEALAIDGRSFLPQLRGEKGAPREWTYCWYARDGGPPAKEFARTQRYKLYRTGEFYDVRDDVLERQPLAGALDGEAATAKALLQNALDRYRDARPAALGGGGKGEKKQKR